MKHKSIIKFCCIFILFIFICSYIVESMGYYEYYLASKKRLTEEEMIKFENDVRDGKEVNIDNYLKESNIDYSNNLTKKTSEISLKFNDYLRGFIGRIFKVLEKLVS